MSRSTTALTHRNAVDAQQDNSTAVNRGCSEKTVGHFGSSMLGWDEV